MNLTVIGKYKIFILLCFLIAIVFVYFSAISIPIGSDPGRLWRNTKFFYDGDVKSAFSTLEPFLSVSLNASLIGISGTSFPLTLVQGLANGLILILVCNYLYKKHGPLTGIFGLLLFLSSFLFFDRSVVLIPYPLFVLFISLGIFSFEKYREDHQYRHLFLSSMFFAYSIYTFNLAVTSLSIVFLFCLSEIIINRRNWKHELKTMFMFYSIIVIFLLPWFTWRFVEAGWKFYNNPITWLMSKYWSEFNIILWHRPEPLTSEYYKFFLTTGIKNLIGPYLFLFFAFIGLLKTEKTLFLFWLLSPVYPLLVGKLPIEERYLYAALPPLVIFTSVGLAQFLEKNSRSFKVLVSLSLVVLSIFTFASNYKLFLFGQSDLKNSKSEILQLGEFMKKGEVIYTRSYMYQPILPENLMMSASHLSEEDAVKLIGWTSDTDITSVMNKYNISWIILYRSPTLERRFNSWITLADQSLTPRHYKEIQISPLFTLVKQTETFLLYRYNN